MRDISDAADLMTTAREALLRDLLPALSGERRYAALMIANGMAIAAREHRLGTRCLAQRRRAAAQPARAASPRRSREQWRPADERRAALRKVICAAIRAGRFDAHESAVGSAPRAHGGRLGGHLQSEGAAHVAGLFIRRRANRWNSN